MVAYDNNKDVKDKIDEVMNTVGVALFFSPEKEAALVQRVVEAEALLASRTADIAALTDNAVKLEAAIQHMGNDAEVMARVHKQEMGVVRAHIDSALMTRDEEAALAREVEVQVEALSGEKDVLVNDLAAESELHNAHKAVMNQYQSQVANAEAFAENAESDGRAQSNIDSLMLATHELVRVIKNQDVFAGANAGDGPDYGAVVTELRRLRDEAVSLKAAEAAEDANAEMEAQIDLVANDVEVYATLANSLEFVEELTNQRRASNAREVVNAALLAALSSFNHALIVGGDLTKECQALKVAAETAGASLPFPTDIGCVATQDQLAHRFDDHLQSFVAAAFAPAATGLFSSIAAHFLGRVLAFLYDVRAEEESNWALMRAASTGATSENNLRALRSAAGFLERGDLSAAFAVLDNRLTGLCRRTAEAWIADARKTLEIWQLLRVLQIKGKCLHSSLI